MLQNFNFFFNLIQLKNSKYDKNQKLKMGQCSRIQNETNPKIKSKCDKTQKVKM